MTTNREFRTPVFERACKMAGIPATKRQASRWRNSKGLARKFKTAAILVLVREEWQKEVKA